VRIIRIVFLTAALSVAAGIAAQETPATKDIQGGKTIDVGKTGFDVKKPVFASACPNGCPWGELGEFVQDAMKPFGYDVVLCRNCNRAEGPRVVAGAKYPPPLSALDLYVGTNVRVNAPVDFGVTESGMLASAYNGRGAYAKDGPYRNLRLIAKIEDPVYLLAAVKKESGITGLMQIKEKRLPVKILASLSASRGVLEYYGLTKEAVESWGGSIVNAMMARADADFDLIISDLATPANNPESAYWPRLSQMHDLRFLDFAPELLDKLASDKELGLIRVTAKWGLLRGVDRPIPTVARSGEAVFARDDMPESVAYEAAKAIDEHQDGLCWYIRPYSYNPKTVWKNFDVPLHPGAARYYREKGYMK
jgi:TRAP transporter TAXI family solute receptor